MVPLIVRRVREAPRPNAFPDRPRVTDPQQRLALLRIGEEWE